MNSTSPRIFIPIPVQDTEKRRFTLGQAYVQGIIRAGGIPTLYPVSLDTATLAELYAESDGVLLTGGADVAPARFGEPAHEKTDGIDLDRDEAECALAQWAVRDGKPVFAICRGIQVLNVALGGSLVQDIPSQWTPASASAAQIQHNGAWITANRSDSLHTVCVEPGTRLAAIIHAGDLGVNSFHHQAVNRLAPDAVVSARSEDGVIEAIELDGHPFCLGVQWHPEEMAAVRPDMQALFDAFVSACAGRKS